MQAFTGECATGFAATGYAYARRQPEKTALYQVFHRHLPSFERIWNDADTGNCLPKHVTQELQQFLNCGILAHSFAQMHCDSCHKRHLVAFSCKGRGFCPSCMGRRMNEGAADLPDHVLHGVPIRQWVLTLPYPLRYPHRLRPQSSGPCAPTLYRHGQFLVWPASPRQQNRFGHGHPARLFQPAPKPTQRGLITFTAAPGDEEVNAGTPRPALAPGRPGAAAPSACDGLALHLPTQATGPPERAQPEPAGTEPLELEWSGQGESVDWPEYPD